MAYKTTTIEQKQGTESSGSGFDSFSDETQCRRKEMFSNDDLKRLIRPLILEQILAVTVGMADVMMVSSVGAGAVSGISLVDTINVLLISLFTALATGGAIVGSQYLGNKDRERACQATEQLVYVILMVSVGIMMFSLVFNAQLLQLIYGRVDQDVFEASRTYFYISALSYPFLALYNAEAAAFRSMGNSKISLYASTIMNVMNIIGNAILIYIFDMGVAGAAISTLVSRIVASIILFVLLKNTSLDIHLPKKFSFRLDRSIIRRILSIGIPNGLESSIFQLGKILVARQIVEYGTPAVTANAIGNTIASFEILPGSAIGLAIITVVGQCVGAREYEQAKMYTKKLLKMSYQIMLGLNIAMFLLLDPVLKLYQQTPEITALARQLIVYHTIMCVIIWPSSFTLPNALRASDDAKFTMIIAIASMWVWRIGFAYILGNYFGFGVFGVWVAMTIDWAFRATCFHIRFHKKKWERPYVDMA